MKWIGIVELNEIGWRHRLYNGLMRNYQKRSYKGSSYTFFFSHTTLRFTLFLNLIVNVLIFWQHSIFQLLVLILELHYIVLLHIWKNVTLSLVRLLVSICWFLLLFLILVSFLWYWSESLMTFSHSKDQCHF